MTVHYQNPYLPHTLRSTAPPARAVANTAAPITTDAEGLPIGTAAQVMTWVGDDPDRAQAFLTKEQRESRPRVSLVANLKAVLKRHEIVVPVVVPVEPPGQLATQVDVIPAERALLAEYEPVDEEPVNQLEIIRERLQREQE